jgi:peroxiredoxin Q/BCP
VFAQPLELQMMLKLVALGVGVAACAVLVAAVVGGRQGTPPDVGDAAPDFTLAASDGQTYHLADLKGTTVILAWFPKAFTGG